MTTDGWAIIVVWAMMTDGMMTSDRLSDVPSYVRAMMTDGWDAANQPRRCVRRVFPYRSYRTHKFQPCCCDDP